MTNNYVNTMNTAAQLNVSGYPYYIAISVDDTNYANDSDWGYYSGSNVTVNPGLTQGWHDVWIGLRGHADDASAVVWQYKRLNLTLPPVLVITNPVTDVVDEPMI